jgi:hypothetical protein
MDGLMSLHFAQFASRRSYDYLVCIGLALAGILLDGPVSYFLLGKICGSSIALWDLGEYHIRILPWTSAFMLLASIFCVRSPRYESGGGSIKIWRFTVHLLLVIAVYFAMTAAMMLGVDIFVDRLGFMASAAMLGSIAGMAAMLFILSAARSVGLLPILRGLSGWANLQWWPATAQASSRADQISIAMEG